MAQLKRLSKSVLSVVLACLMLATYALPAIAVQPEKQPGKVTVSLDPEVFFCDENEEKLSETLVLSKEGGEKEKQLVASGIYYTYTFYAFVSGTDMTMPDLEITSDPAGVCTLVPADNAVQIKVRKSLLNDSGVAIDLKLKKPVTYQNVTVQTSGDGFTVDPTGVTSVEQGTEFSLNITLDSDRRAGYQPRIVDNGAVQTIQYNKEGKYTYKINSVEDRHIISVSLVAIPFTVTRSGNWDNVQTTLPVNGATVTYGNPYSFSLSPKAGYTLATNPVTITMGEDELTEGEDYALVGNQYTIFSVTDNVTVTLNEVTSQQFTVNWKNGTGYKLVSESDGEITSGQKVNYGQEFKFKVALDPGYSNTDMTVTANGTLLIPNGEGVYTISNVTADQSIVVSGVAKNSYTITHTQSTGYTFSAQSAMYNVPHGSSFSFTITPAAGYQIDKVEVKKTNGDGEALEVSSFGNVYTIGSVEDNLTITVTATEMKYTLTASSAESDGYTLDGNEDTYTYAQTAALTIKAKNGYIVTGVYTEVNGVRTLVHGNESDVYSFAVTSNMKVVVTTDTIKYTVTYQDSKNSTTVETYDVKSGVTFVEGNKVQVKLNKADPTSTYYTFNGWSYEERNGLKTGETITLDAGVTSATVTAQWTLDSELLKQITKNSVGALGLTQQFDDNKLRFKVTWNLGGLRSAISEIADADFDIVSVGIVYSNDVIDDEWKAQVERLDQTVSVESEGKEVQVDGKQNQYLYYYIDGRPLAEQADNASFSFSKVNGTRYAIGWITLKIGNVTVTLYTNPETYTP